MRLAVALGSGSERRYKAVTGEGWYWTVVRGGARG